MLKVVDRKWMDHIDDMEQLRQYRPSGLRPEGSACRVQDERLRDVQCHDSSIQEDTLRLLYHVRVEQKAEREEVAK